MCLAWMVEKFEFWRTCLAGNPIVAPPIFVRFYFIFNVYLFRNFDISSFNGLKVLSFGGLDWGGSPQPGTPDFIPALVLLDISNRSNFKYSAFTDL